MPDPLLANDGQTLTAPAQWPARREEMKRILEDYEFGHMPPPPGNVKSHELQSKLLDDGRVGYRNIHLSFGPDETLGFDVGLFSPSESSGRTKPFPTIVHLSYGAGERALGQYTEALRRGYAVAAIDYRQLGADNPNYRQSAFFPTYPQYDWRDFSAWAWGLSRCVDFLQTDPATDKTKMIAVGVSRLAQAVQLAGAMDERIALVGAVGAGSAFRFSGKGRGGKQGLDEVLDQNTYWFGPRLPEFHGQTDRLPFDQHWLLALAAPRAFILCDALEDQYGSVNAAVQSYLAAKPVFALLGAPERLGIHFRPGQHGMPSDDWLTLLDFCDWQLLGKKIERRFDQLPSAELSPQLAIPPPAAPAPAPAAIDPNSDRARMLTLLGLPMPPRAAASNTDESKALAPNAKFPDPLVLNNGQRATDAATWWNQRRPEIFEDFARDIYGRVPVDTPKVTWEVTKSEDDGAVKTKTIVGKIDHSRFPALSPTIQLTLKTPSKTPGPVPVIVYAQAFGGGQVRSGQPRAASAPAATPAGPSLEALTLEKGWGYATFNTASVQPDSESGLTQGIIGLVNKGEMRAKPDDWGVLMAWAWGLSKSIDYFETDPDVDTKRLAVDGFSRWGKTAVLAAALDPRWALAWAGNSGQSGTKMNRRNFGETVDMVAQNFPYWMAGNFQKFVGHWDDMAVDAHELVALVAPRPVFVTAGTTDLHTDPKGMFLAAALASPVYELLGARGLGSEELPPPDTALIAGDIGFRLHTGGHTPTPDYASFLEFCAKYFQTPKPMAGE